MRKNKATAWITKEKRGENWMNCIHPGCKMLYNYKWLEEIYIVTICMDLEANWKGWLGWGDREKRNLKSWLLCIPDTGRFPLHTSALTRLASYVYDKAENKCTDESAEFILRLKYTLWGNREVQLDSKLALWCQRCWDRWHLGGSMRFPWCACSEMVQWTMKTELVWIRNTRKQTSLCSLLAELEASSWAKMDYPVLPWWRCNSISVISNKTLALLAALITML